MESSDDELFEELTLPSLSSYPNDPESSDDEREDVPAKSSRGPANKYSILKQFGTKAEYDAWWSTEKKNWTFHSRTHKKFELAETCVFFKKVEEFIGYESARMKELPKSPSIPLKVFKEAYELEKSLKPDAEKKRLMIRLKGTKNYIISSSAPKLPGSGFANSKEMFAAYRRLFHQGPASWDEYARTRFNVYFVQLVNRYGEEFYICSCWDGSKKKVCKHAGMVTCMEKLQPYPVEVTAQAMKPNRKRSHKKSAGRDPLAPTQNRFSAAD